MKSIKLIVLDVDGTLTDGKIYYDNNGNEIKSFNVKDGMGIIQALKSGINIAIITARKSSIVEKRSSELGIKYVFQGVHNKVKCLEQLLKDLNLDYRDTIYIGDDINDIGVMEKVRISACPRDSAELVKEKAHFISNYNGGDGAVREIIENVLKSQEKWRKIIENY